MRNLNFGVVLLLVFIACAAAIDNVFLDFMTKYNKQYSSVAEQALRYEIFKATLLKIEEHNKVSTFQIGVNQFADMSTEEFVKTHLSTKPAHHSSFEELSMPELNADAPAAVDWRTHKDPVVVGPVRNAGECGSSAVFSIVDSIASNYAIVGNDDVYTFDPKYVSDCDGQGCNGGFDSTVWSFIQKFGLQWYYTQCPTVPGLGICISGYNCTKTGSEDDLVAAVSRVGPIVINIDASRSTFQLYKSGIYYEAACSTSQLNHDLLLVGYGSSNGQDFWIARNSWGSSWGQGGDILLARNKNNNCGVATSACYARTPHSCVC